MQILGTVIYSLNKKPILCVEHKSGVNSVRQDANGFTVVANDGSQRVVKYGDYNTFAELMDAFRTPPLPSSIKDVSSWLVNRKGWYGYLIYGSYSDNPKILIADSV